MTYEQKMEYTEYYLKSQNRPIDDRIFHTQEEAESALEELKVKVPSLAESVSVASQTIKRTLLTE